MRSGLISLMLVALGGGLGSACRYGISLWAQYSWPTHSWVGTLSVNVLGSFVIGLIAILARDIFPHSQYLAPLLMVGFCGGFTTFSSFCLDAYRLYGMGEWGMAITYVLLSFFLSFLALLLGFYLGSIFFK